MMLMLLISIAPLSPSANLFLLFNQFNKFSPQPKNEPVNIVNSNYYDNDQFETLKFHENVSHYPQNLPHFQYKFAKLFH